MQLRAAGPQLARRKKHSEKSRSLAVLGSGEPRAGGARMLMVRLPFPDSRGRGCRRDTRSRPHVMLG
jgi:hypothetical protein